MAAPVTFFVAVTAFLLVKWSQANSSLGLEPEAPPPPFSYSGDTGPDKWGNLSLDYAACSVGRSQSPIDIVESEAVRNTSLKLFQRVYNAFANATLVNRGVSVGIEYEEGGYLIIEGKNYTLEQMTWHTPAEHKINGVTYAAELQLFHRSSDGSVAIIAIVYKFGMTDHLMSEILGEMDLSIRGLSRHPRLRAVGVNTWLLRLKVHKYYRYDGSLTTPPCDENVIWHVFAQVWPMSVDQVNDLQFPLPLANKKNARPVQPLYLRQVQLYDKV